MTAWSNNLTTKYVKMPCVLSKSGISSARVRMLVGASFACRPATPLQAANVPKAQPSKTLYQESQITLTSGDHAQQCRAAKVTLTRRQYLTSVISVAALLGLSPRVASAIDEHTSSSPALGVLEAIRRDFVDRQYYVTGDLSRQLFTPDCVFKDPTVEVVGVEPYVKALQILFDPTTSRADLISITATAADKVVLRWRLEGSLKIGGLKIKPYTGTTVYTISDGGQVTRHEETWDISTVDAFVSTFLPGFGAPPAPPVSLLVEAV